MKKLLMRWTGWKAAVKTVYFLLILALVLGWVNAVLALKSFDGLHPMQQLYEQKENSVDLLVLGSSHAFVNIDSGTLWEEYGISAYDLAGGAQPFWNTYYFLKEALKTQSPKLIVMDAFTAVLTVEYNDNGRAVSNTFGMKWSWDKVEAIKLSAPPDKQSSFLLGYCQYHTRFRELTREDFLEDKGDSAKYANWKGSYVSTGVSPFQWPAYVQTEDRSPMTAKTEEWYRKTIELAQSSGVPLLIVVTPYPAVTAEHQAIYNTAADIAGEYGVPFVNFNQNFGALELDPATDYFDGHHMNVWGSQKFTKQLGNLLTERYDLPDHRGGLGVSVLGGQRTLHRSLRQRWQAGPRCHAGGSGISSSEPRLYLCSGSQRQRCGHFRPSAGGFGHPYGRGRSVSGIRRRGFLVPWAGEYRVLPAGLA